MPLVLLIPEDQQSSEKVLNKIDDMVCRFGRALVGICEGYKISKYEHAYDLAGQKMYGSSRSSAMQQLINMCNDNGIQARGFNPTIDQRQNFNYTLDSDIDTSYSIGSEIISNFAKGNRNFFQSYSSRGLKAIDLDLIKDYSRNLKKSWVDFGNFDVTDEYISYLEAIGLQENSARKIICTRFDKMNYDSLNVVIVAYSRVDSFRQVLASCEKYLKKIKIVIDYPETNSISKSQDKILEIVKKSHLDCKIVKREFNHGLVNSILRTVNDELSENDHIIVLEDDCVPVKGFFDFMYEGLKKHRDDPKISTICGTVTSCRFNPWGWATWKNKWDYKYMSPPQILEIENLDKNLKEFIKK